jgi:hypothetical protein
MTSRSRSLFAPPPRGRRAEKDDPPGMNGLNNSVDKIVEDFLFHDW